ncbi:MAG TPA: flagellar assembly protein FliW [Chloroflexota bacterium]|nr:flagellar assembly protein FliW [Chloroflexota bacterium]
MSARKRRPAASPARGLSLTVQRFGAAETLHVDSEDVITFPAGLIGMESLRRFALLSDPRIDPCRWLQSLDDPDVSFVVVDPRVIDPSYSVDFDQGELVDSSEVLAIMTIHVDPKRSTANLLAPVLVDLAARTGRQVVRHESGYDVRHPIAHEGWEKR